MLDRFSTGTESLRGSLPDYEMSKQDIDELSVELFDERAVDTPEKYEYITIEVEGSSKFANIGRHIEREVFEVEFPGNDAEMFAKSYGPYDQASRFFISIDRISKRAVGVLRVIKNSDHGLMTLNDVQDKPFFIGLQEIKDQYGIDDLDEVWDVGTAGVLPEHRDLRGLVSIQLYRAMYLSARKNDIKHLVSIVDEKLLPTLTKFLRIPFVALAGVQPGPYLGSESSQPVYGYIPDFYKKAEADTHTNTGIRKTISDRLIEGTEDDALRLLDI